MVIKRSFQQNLSLILLVLVLSSNAMLYHTAFGTSILPENANGVVIGSMIDLALISPVLFLAWKKSWNWKSLIIGIASGLILVRLLIPMEYLAPFEAITWAGFAVEGLLVLAEMLLLASLMIFMPKIIVTAKKSPLPVLFSFSDAVDKHVKPLPIIRIICSEMLMFYYAFASWRKKPEIGVNMFTLHHKSSLIAFQIMMIHAIVIETIGIHWWLHDKFLILSIILLLLNIYSVVFFLGDIQAVRLNPLQVREEGIYLSLGLAKRMFIRWSDIEEIIDESEILKQKLSKDTIDFIARDFESVQPDVIFKFKEPVEASLIMGLKKKFNKVAIKVDDPLKFKEIIKEYM
jgi:hypothetical protein